MAGGENLFGSPGQPSPWLDWDQLVVANPDVVVVHPCGFDIARTLQRCRFSGETPGGMGASSGSIGGPTMGEGVSHHEGGHPLRQLVVILLVFWNSMPIATPGPTSKESAISSGRGTVVGDVCFTAISCGEPAQRVRHAPKSGHQASAKCTQTLAAWFRREDYERIREIMETG